MSEGGDKFFEPDCDVCTKPITGEIYKVCLTRPSDPVQLCSVMWTHEGECAAQVGAKSDSHWEAYAQRERLNYEG